MAHTRKRFKIQKCLKHNGTSEALKTRRLEETCQVLTPLLSGILLFSLIFPAWPRLFMLPNSHKQVSGGKLRYLRTQVSDRPRAKEPAPLGFWVGDGSPGGGWGGGVGFAFAARAGRDGCPSRVPGAPPAPSVSLLRPAAPPAPLVSLPRPSVPPAPPVSPRLRRPYYAPTSQPLALAPAPEDPDRGTRPAGRARGRPRAASEGWPRRAPTWRGRRAGKRSAGPGSSREPWRPRLRGTREGWSGAQGGRARRVRLRRLRTPGLPERGARGADRCGRGEVAIDPVLATDPFIRAAGGRSSEPGRRTSEESAPRAGGRGAQGAGDAPEPPGRAGLWAPGQRPGGVPAWRHGRGAATPAPLLLEAGRDSPGSCPMPTSHDSGWKQGVGRRGGSQEVVFRCSRWTCSREEGSVEGFCLPRPAGTVSWGASHWCSGAASLPGLCWRLILASLQGVLWRRYFGKVSRVIFKFIPFPLKNGIKMKDCRSRPKQQWR